MVFADVAPVMRLGVDLNASHPLRVEAVVTQGLLGVIEQTLVGPVHLARVTARRRAPWRPVWTEGTFTDRT